MKGLSPRLARVGAMIGTARCLVDVGSDHGLLPIRLIEAGLVERAIAVELTEGPFQTAQTAIARACLSDRVSARMGDGLCPIEPGEVDVIAIAGMGAQTIWDIVTTEHGAIVRSTGHPRLVLQPMGGAGLMRYFAHVFGYKVLRDERVQDGELVYECLELAVADESRLQVVQEQALRHRTDYENLSPEDRVAYVLGLVGLNERCPLLAMQIQDEVAKRKRMLQELSHATSERAHWRLDQIRGEIDAFTRAYDLYFEKQC